MMRKLNAYIEEVRSVPFEWGVHDCFTFTNACFRKLYGSGWAEDWQGAYMIEGRPMDRSELMRKFGFHTFEQAACSRLQKLTGVPPRGALVTSARPQRWVAGIALGISMGQSAVFVGLSGLVFHPIEVIDGAWAR